MWCSNCQQDVPAIASLEGAGVRCARCSGELSRWPASPRTPAADSVTREPGRAPRAHGPVRPTPSRSTTTGTAHTNGTTGAPPAYPVDRPAASPPAFFEEPEFDLDTWQWDEELREAGRLVRSLGYVAPPTTEETSAVRAVPRHSSAAELRTGHGTAPRPPISSPAVRSPRGTSRYSLVAWLAISLGVMALVFGGVLLGWSCFTDRAELWSLGLPFALGGQGALVLGLVLQLDGLSQSNHDTAASISDLDHQVSELRHAAMQWTSTHSSASQSFYFHLAEGCSPHMLLADLKGQLDLLALRMAEDK